LKISWSLDDLEMELEMGNTKVDNQSFLIGGLFLENADWNSPTQELCKSEKLISQIPAGQLRWVKKDVEGGKPKDKSTVEVPVFLSRSRRQYICLVEMPIPKDTRPQLWYQRGVAIILSST